MRIGRLEVKADRWPWQRMSNRWDQKNGSKYGWWPVSGLGRFGGGWNFKLGIYASARSVNFDLIFGSVYLLIKPREDAKNGA